MESTATVAAATDEVDLTAVWGSAAAGWGSGAEDWGSEAADWGSAAAGWVLADFVAVRLLSAPLSW